MQTGCGEPHFYPKNKICSDDDLLRRDAPHPNAGILWARWLISEEGQRAFAQAGETPAHPKIEPMEKILPAKTYMLTADDTKEFPKYQKLWNEIFQLR